MADKQRCLMIGAGGMARAWIQRFLPEFHDRLTVVGLVELKPETLREGGTLLGLPSTRCFTDHRQALAAVQADCAFICIPPAVHTPVTVDCLEAGLDVLCEKPIADTWEGCLAMAEAARRTARRVQIIQNYRYTERILTLKAALADAKLGRLNYLYGRFAADYRTLGAWGLWRHRIPHALLLEGSVHHFDQLRNLAGGDCLQLAGWDWNPAWSSFEGESTALFTMTFSGGVRGVYEGNCSEAGWQNPWHREYYRAECEGGAVVLDNDNVVRIIQQAKDGGQTSSPAPLVRPEYDDGHRVQIGQFLAWRLGGPTPDTVLADNLKTAAMVFAAIEASESGQVVDVAGKLANVVA